MRITVTNIGFHAPPQEPGGHRMEQWEIRDLAARLDFKSDGEVLSLELRNLRAKPERERDSLGHFV